MDQDRDRSAGQAEHGICRDAAARPDRTRRRTGPADGRPLLRIWPFWLFSSAFPPPLAAQDASAEETRRPVKLVTLSAASDPLEREFFGRVRAREAVDLAFQVGGQIVEFPVVEGRSLDDGAMVAQLDLTPFRREVERAEVDLAKAERDLNRFQELEGPAVSEVRVSDARTQADLARIAAEEAQERLDDATLETTFEALVARRIVENYTTVTAGRAVVRLHDMPEVLFRSASGGAEVSFEASFPGSATVMPWS